MAAFASGGPPNGELNGAPHHDLPPPVLEHAAFAHQLQPHQTYTQGQSRMSHRTSLDFKRRSNGSFTGANGNGAVPVPGASHHRMNNGGGPHARETGFGAARSPPSSKNTSHVPCKFYRQGACQAGKACPFLHSDEPLTERAPCKYFAKGNCKFGPKCALAHVLPNGQVVNRNAVGVTGPFGRMNIPHYPEMPPNNSLLSMQAHQPQAPLDYPYHLRDDMIGSQKPHHENIPTIDTTSTYLHNPSFGSPPHEQSRLPVSPLLKGLTVMDVQLPASFDSQGISHAARYGPIASSVPAKFLAHSPPSSFQGDSPALRNLHDSAFGDTRKAAALGASPPDLHDQPSSRRFMHSELGAPRAKASFSASVGARPPYTPNDEWDDSELIGKFEEELLPSSLNDLLTPEEKFRRFSRDNAEESNSLSHRASLPRLGVSPTTSDAKAGSPAASSPSRFQSLWGKRQGPENGYDTGSPLGTSQFGHVGSPLRNSAFHQSASPSSRAVSRTMGDTNSYFSSPPRQASMSMISQQLQRTRLTSRGTEDVASTTNHVHPGLNRLASNSSVTSASGRLGMDRAVSSSSINRERIEEEQGLFSMEEEDEYNALRNKDGASTTSSTSNKRLSGLSWGSGGKASPKPTPNGPHRGGKF